jgi:hypothetical protein
MSDFTGFEDLEWLVGRYRAALRDPIATDLERYSWRQHIAEDFGDDVAAAVERALANEQEPRWRIEAARAEWKARLADTYIIVLDAYNNRGGD